MSMDLNFFQLGPIPSNTMGGSYNLGLVALSYLIAVLASYVALDLAGRLRAEKQFKHKIFWLLGGAFALGAGIWSMHFIGMLAFIMPMPMRYDFFWTISSMLVAILAAGLALFLLRNEKREKFKTLIVGGVFIGLGIATMHYMGMQGMTSHVNIRYLPSLFLLSILIAILASEAALWLAMRSNQGSLGRQFQIKVGSALVMGAAICGMHYTGMAAAVFTPLKVMATDHPLIDPFTLSFYIAGITGAIITIALLASTYKQLMVSAVQNEKNFLNAMLDNLEDGIIASDSKGKITLINRTLLDKLNSAGKINTLKHNLVKYFHLDSKAAKKGETQNPLARALNGERIHSQELLMKVNDDETRDVVMDGQPIVSAQGKKLGSVVVIHDVTERLRVERLKNEFVSTVSHELRTPLTSIRGSLSLIKGGAAGKLNEKTKELLDIAHNNCERLIRLINDILDIEKIEAGKMDFVLQPTPIADLVNNAISINQAFGQKFNVKIELESDIPNVKVNVDKDRIIQVLTNLISNAVKFSPPNAAVGVTVNKKNHWVVVSVIDRGKGISEEFQHRIFQKFAQADSSNMRKQGGTGLGLSISKTIVERLGGTLEFKTKAEEGTTFYFQLPIWHEPDTSVKASPKISRILICEDDKDIASLLSIVLQDNGFQVENAYSIKEAKNLLSSKKFDAMTLDLILPDGDGISLVHDLRNDEKYEKLPIIVISAKLGARGKLVNGEAINIVDWLYKPVDAKKLIGAIEHIKKRIKPGKPSILHIEDDRDLLNIIANMVEADATLKGAGTLKEAKRILAKEKFDLVLLDLILPDGSGVELLPELARLRIPVIVFSAFELPKDYVQYVTTALTKSRTTDKELLAAIKAAINKIGDHHANA